MNRGGWRSIVSCAACRSFYDWCRLGGAAKLPKCSTGTHEFRRKTSIMAMITDVTYHAIGLHIPIRHHVVLRVSSPH